MSSSIRSNHGNSSRSQYIQSPSRSSRTQSGAERVGLYGRLAERRNRRSADYGDAVDRGWHIREPSPDDAPAISDVLTAAGVAAWGSFLGEDRIAAATTGAEHPADLVAVDDDGVFAFVAWDVDTGEIQRLYTHPRGQGRGAGRVLLEQALDALRAAGRTRAWLNTEERNEAARRFYERNGWREDGEVRVRDWHGARLREPRYVKDL
jgi:ribosomal protein S18 acetylase RimI-like enzyme